MPLYDKELPTNQFRNTKANNSNNINKLEFKENLNAANYYDTEK